MRKNKKYINLTVAIIFFLLSVFPNIEAFATRIDPDAEIKKNQEDKENFLKGLEDAGYSDSLEQILKTLFTNNLAQKTKDNSVDWYVQYLLTPGAYIKDVTNGVFLEGFNGYTDKTVVQEKLGKKTICDNSKEPQNLLNHNCTIPTFATEFTESLLKTVDASGIVNGERTASKEALSLGMPISIPEDEVPVDPEKRKYKYTALELYGYNLPYTSYLGEWDSIVVSTEARLLSNVGFWQKAKLAGASVLRGVQNSISQFWDNWIYNPAKQGKKKVGFVDGVVSTVVDTSDLYVASNHYWKRPFFNKTLYNATYLTDKEVINEGQRKFFRYFRENLYEKAKQYPRIRDVLYLDATGPNFIRFTFNPKKRSHANQKEYDDWVSCNQANSQLSEQEKTDCGSEPAFEVMPEKEQFQEWKTEEKTVEYNNFAKTKGIDCHDNSDSFSDILSCWSVSWSKYAEKEVNHDATPMQQVMRDMENEYFSNNPHLDPNRGISHYVCTDENGIPLRDENGGYKYLYLKENSPTAEFVNPECNVVRPTIDSGYFGKGYGEKSKDTRAIIHENTRGFEPNELSFLGNLNRKIAVFFSKLTNTVVSLSYSDFMETLGMGNIVKQVFRSFEDSIYFPLALLIMSLSFIYLLFQFKNQGTGIAKAITQMIAVFLLGIILLAKPAEFLSLGHNLMNMLENEVLNIAISRDDNKACSADGDGSGIRAFQCTVWDITVFQPWILGQWGTSYENLAKDNFSNKNADLVGDAEVYMGGGVYENNWGLYQLDLMKTGTITTDDPKKIEGVTSSQLYKLVDLQAGPNNGEKSDPRYLLTWTGISSNRNSIQFFASVVSIGMFIVIGLMALIKIEISLTFALYLAYLPFLMLLALFPNRKEKLLEHIKKMGSLVAKRLAIAIYLVVAMLFVKVIATNGDDYVISAFFVVIMLYCFIRLRKELFSMLSPEANKEGMGKFLSPQNIMPRSMYMEYQMKKLSIQQGFTGMLGGSIAGSISMIKNRKEGFKSTRGNEIFSGAMRGWKQGFARGQGVEFRRQRRNGLGILTEFKQVKDAATRGIERDFNNQASKTRIRAKTVVDIIAQKVYEYEKRIEDKEILSENDLSQYEIYKTANKRLEKVTGGNSDGNWKADENNKINSILTDIKSSIKRNKDGKLVEKNIDDITFDVAKKVSIVAKSEQANNPTVEAEQTIKKEPSFIDTVKETVTKEIKSATEVVKDKFKSDFDRDMEKYYEQFSKDEFLKSLGDSIDRKGIENTIRKLEEKANFKLSDNMRTGEVAYFDELGKASMDKSVLSADSKRKHSLMPADPFLKERMIERAIMENGLEDKIIIKKPHPDDYTSSSKKYKKGDVRLDKIVETINSMTDNTQAKDSLDNYKEAKEQGLKDIAEQIRRH